MQTIKKAVVLASLSLFSISAQSYPYLHCEGNGTPLKVADTDVRFVINEGDFSQLEISRLENSVSSWTKERLGETSLNINPNSGVVPEVSILNEGCSILANLSPFTPADQEWHLLADVCKEEAFAPLEDYSVIFRSIVIGGGALLYNPIAAVNNMGLPLGLIIPEIVTPPAFVPSQNFPTATSLCFGASNGVPGIGVGSPDPLLKSGLNIYLTRPRENGWLFGNPAGPIGTIQQLSLYTDSFQTTPTDINLVTTHEIGHVVGLAHPSTGSRIKSVMRADYDENPNFQNSNSNKFIRTALPLPIDGKNIHNLYTATTPSLKAAATNQWEHGETGQQFRLRQQASYTSLNGSNLTGEVTSVPHSLFTALAVPVTLHNNGTTNEWVSGWVRYRRVGAFAAAPKKPFGMQMPPRSSARIIRWTLKPHPSHGTIPGTYNIETHLETPVASNFTPHQWMHRSVSGNSIQVTSQ